MSDLDRTPTEILDFLESLGIGDDALDSFRWNRSTGATVALSSCEDFRKVLATASAKAQREDVKGRPSGTTRIFDSIIADDLVATHVCRPGRDCWPAKAVSA